MIIGVKTVTMIKKTNSKFSILAVNQLARSDALVGNQLTMSDNIDR
jgi:hypothetical protein